MDVYKLSVCLLFQLVSACIAIGAQAVGDEFHSVSGRFLFYAKGWNAMIHNGGPVNAKNGCDGYASRGECEVFWEYIENCSLGEVEHLAKQQRLPLWIGIPPWDKGFFETVVASGDTAEHVVIHRTNGRVPELVYLFREGNGILCIHVIKPEWSKQDLASIVGVIYKAARGKIKPTGKTVIQSHAACGENPKRIPDTFEAAVIALNNLLTVAELERLKKLDGVYGLVETIGPVPTGGILWGPEIARRWGLVDGGSPLACELASAGLKCIEDQEAAIILGLQRRLQGKEYGLKIVKEELLKP